MMVLFHVAPLCICLARLWKLKGEAFNDFLQAEKVPRLRFFLHFINENFSGGFYKNIYKGYIIVIS